MRKRIAKGQRHAVLAVSCNGTKVSRNESGMNVISAAVYYLVELGVKRFVGTLQECEMLKQEFALRNINLSIVKA